MADTQAFVAISTPPLTEVQRVSYTFSAPRKTFTDILRKATFWGPLLVMIVVSVLFAFAVQQKIGWERVFENNLHQSPAREEQFEKLPPEQAAMQRSIGAKITSYISYGYTAVVLIITAVTTLLVWVTVNFGFGGTAKYPQIYAVNMYSSLVMNIKYLLAVISIFAGLAPDSFLLQNPVGTNIGYFLPTEAPKWLMTLCTHLDIFEIWSLILATIGVSIVAKVSRGKAAVAVFGWWLILVLVGVGVAAAQ